MALMRDLPNSGKVVLSGDQWHFLENLENDGVPSFNFKRAETLASSDRLNKLITNNKAMLIIQHEPSHVSRLPQFPKYLD